MEDKMMKLYTLIVSTALTVGCFSAQASQTPSEELVSLTRAWAEAGFQKEKQLQTNSGDVTALWKQAMVALGAAKTKAEEEKIDFSQTIFPLYQKLKKEIEEESRKPKIVTHPRPSSPPLGMTLLPKADPVPSPSALTLLVIDEEDERITPLHRSLGVLPSFKENDERPGSPPL